MDGRRRGWAALAARAPAVGARDPLPRRAVTPATAALRTWTGRHAFVSFARPEQLPLAAEVCQSFALDNGAFSLWRAGTPVDWQAFYGWVADWRRHPGFDFAVVPDVIDGSEAENDALAADWPFPRHEGAVVWHINESFERLERLAEAWPRVAIGSSGAFDVSRPKPFLARAREALAAICDDDGYPACKLHGLRMLNPAIFSQLPLASADSTTSPATSASTPPGAAPTGRARRTCAPRSSERMPDTPSGGRSMPPAITADAGRQEGDGRAGEPGQTVDDADGAGSQGRRDEPREHAGERSAWPPGPDDAAGWRRYLGDAPELEPAVRRGADGLAIRVDRLRLCGNGVVPLVAAHALRTLAGELLADG